MEEKGEKSEKSAGSNKTRVKTEPSSFYTGREMMSILIYSYDDALQPVLNNGSSQNSYLQRCTLTSPPNPNHPCKQACEAFNNAGV